MLVEPSKNALSLSSSFCSFPAFSLTAEHDGLC